VTEEFAKTIGADAYGKDAMACVDTAKSLATAQRSESAT
jgi:methanogenic corrinoid protein MtbC1